MAENTREIVLDMLLTLERGEEYSHRLMKAVLDKYDYLDGKEKSFIKRVTEGTIERRIELDYYLNHFSSVSVKKMKPLIRCLLRMSVYQIVYMDSVPDSAVCNEACKLAGKRKFVNLKGFVNGVLRNISKQKENLPMPDESINPALFLSVKYSMPEWLVEQWLTEYGREITATLLEGLLQIHPVSLRFQTTLSKADKEKYLAEMTRDKENVDIHQSDYLPYVYTIQGAENVGNLPGFEQGAVTVQDVSSALAVEAAGITGEDFVMDICAAPGGKSILAAEKAEKVLARDVSEMKVTQIQENLERMKVQNVETQVFDATGTDEKYIEKADVVLLDVPCSGLGVMGKKRDIKYNVTPEGITNICRLQKEILQKSWQYVRPGGILLYSTCTVNFDENEGMVQWITQNLPFEPESLEAALPSKIWEQKQQLHKLRGENGREKNLTARERAACIQLLPGFMEADGFFLAKFRRKA